MSLLETVILTAIIFKLHIGGKAEETQTNPIMFKHFSQADISSEAIVSLLKQLIDNPHAAGVGICWQLFDSCSSTSVSSARVRRYVFVTTSDRKNATYCQKKVLPGCEWVAVKWVAKDRRTAWGTAAGHLPSLPVLSAPSSPRSRFIEM